MRRTRKPVDAMTFVERWVDAPWPKGVRSEAPHRMIERLGGKWLAYQADTPLDFPPSKAIASGKTLAELARALGWEGHDDAREST